jgi:hypothetical protein
MRRPTRLGFAILAALLVIAGAYTAYWLVVAGQIKDGLRDNAINPSPDLRVSAVSGTARPWDFADWQLEAKAGFSAELVGAGERASVKLTTRTADGVVSLEPESGWKLWLRLQDTTVEAGDRVGISSADGWVIIPPKPPRSRVDPALGLALNLRQVRLPVAIGPLGDTIEQLDFDVTVKGGFPTGKLAQAAAAWRDRGGIIELDNLDLRWGGLGAVATGTVALDQELQPIGGFSGAIQGYDKVLTALVQNGHMRATDAGLARIALTMLAKAGPDGKPEIKTALTIQNGQMLLGPAKLGKAPRITWE